MKLEINKEKIEKVKKINKSYYVLLFFMIGLSVVSLTTNIKNNQEVFLEDDVSPVFSNAENNEVKEEIVLPEGVKELCKFPITKKQIVSFKFSEGLNMLEVNANEKIYSMLDGIVENIYLDYCYGYTIVVNSGDYKVKYSNVDPNFIVEFGQKVKAGEIIGESIEYSLMDTSYIYVNFYYKDKLFNINDILRIV